MISLRFKRHAESEAGTSRPIPRGKLGHQLATDPFLDWALILAIAACAALILVGVGVSVYLGTRSLLESPDPEMRRAPAMPLDEAALAKALGAIGDRKADRSRALSGAGIPRDPSLP